MLGKDPEAVCKPLPRRKDWWPISYPSALLSLFNNESM